MNDIERNKELCAKYPFIIPRNSLTNEVLENYDYSWTKLDEMPQGWKKAFGENLCEEIKQALYDSSLSLEQAKSYRIIKIKERFGMLRLCSNFFTREIDIVIKKYEKLSIRTCSVCGAPATKITKNWISPCCDKCIGHKEKYWTMEEYFNSEDDIL